MTRMTSSVLAVILSCAAPLCIRAADADLLIADFEADSYDTWTATGDAFGPGPARGQLPGQMNVAGFEGKGLVNTFFNGDRTTGRLTASPFKIERRFINFLVGGGAHEGKTCVNLLVDGKPVRTTAGRDNEYLDWATWDVAEFRGRDVRIEIVDEHTGGWGHVNVDQIVQSDTRRADPIDVSTLYNETYRPQFHFTAKKNWLNDPNGMVFYKGTWHLFFQHNPHGNAWGNMSWGHATSPDGVRWTEQPIALHVDPLGTMFSGSAVVDHDNTAGFQRGDEKTLVALYTAAGGTSPESKGKSFTQCLAYSIDAGATWTKYDKNPVLGHVRGENRDPKIVWHAPSKRWVMALYLDKADFAFYASPDLKTWTHLHDMTVPGTDECPDFFEMPVDGEPGQSRWVWTAANGKYLVGTFDGKRFTPDKDGGPHVGDYGPNFYAVQTYDNAPDHRRVQIAWMRGGAYPQMPFNGQMSFPCDLKLRRFPEGLRVTRTPAKEIETLYANRHNLADVALTDAPYPIPHLTHDLLDLRAEFALDGADEVTLRVRGQSITYSAKDKKLKALGREAPLDLPNGKLSLRVLLDRTSLEVFANDGRVSLTGCFVPRAKDRGVEVFSAGGKATLVSLRADELKSAWGTARKE